MNLSNKTKHLHLFFLSFLMAHYVLPLIFVGEMIVETHDNLDIGVVYDHIISKIYKGDLNSIGYFLSGEFKWYYLEKLFFPINILHFFLNDEFFYFTNDILKKLFPYFSFYLLAKSLKINKFSSAFGALLYSTIINIHPPLGFGLPLLPYVLYLLINKSLLNKKHYFVLFFIGLNSALVQDFFTFILLILFSFLLKKRDNSLSLNLKVLFAITIPLIFSSLHLIVGSMTDVPIHREVFVFRNDLISSFILAFETSIFWSLDFNDPRFIFRIPLIILLSILFMASAFSSQRNMKIIFYFIIIILLLKVFLNYNLIDNLFIGFLEVFKGFSFDRVDRLLTILFPLLFIFYISVLKNKKFKKFLYLFSFISIIFIQLMIPLPEIGRYFLENNMQVSKLNETKKNILEKNYFQAIKIILNTKNYEKNKIHEQYFISKTFSNYYKFEDYAFIKNIIKDSRVMSVGLDPMIAVMNDIKVIDGYHTIYPLSYKIKFRKIIEKELEKNVKLKNYYDNWGSRVYAFYSDQNNLMLNFTYAKKLDADYIISKFPINSSDLKIICYKCNNSNQIFLYKIL